jgi:hypothetical protein
MIAKKTNLRVEIFRIENIKRQNFTRLICENYRITFLNLYFTPEKIKLVYIKIIKRVQNRTKSI